MLHKRLSVFLFLALPLFLGGVGAVLAQPVPAAGQSGGMPGPVVARVGSSVLTLEDYLLLSELYSGEGQTQLNPQDIVDAWIDQEIIFREAQRIGLDTVDTVGMMLRRLEFAYELQRRNLLFQAWVTDQAGKIEITKRDMQRFFRDHKDDFLSEVKVAQIVVSDPMLAAYIYQKLLQGADFKSLARQYTLDTLKGESTPFLPLGSGYFLSFANEDAVFSLKPGQFTLPLETSEGVSVIFKLEEKFKVRKDVSYDEVEPYIEAKLRYQRSEELLSATLDSLRAAAQGGIQFHPENLPR